MTTFIGIIPARYGSSRFPGKPLCDICGKPMIYRAYQSAKKWPHWKDVFIATDSSKIAKVCSEYAIPYLMTKDTHIDCLDRAAEAVTILEKDGRAADKYIILQGDEPLFDVETLNVDLSAPVINFYTEIRDINELYNANIVKAVVSKASKALYFSRYSIPYHDEKTKRSDAKLTAYKQIGVYVFTGEMIKLYSKLKMSYLEALEGIGLLRLLENDIDVHMQFTEHDSISVDTPEDQQRIIRILKNRGSEATDKLR